MDLISSVWVVWEVIKKLELELVANPAPKLQWEAVGGDVILHDKECGDGNESSVILP